MDGLSSAGTTDEQLIAEVRAGSRAAVETLFQRYRGDVWRFFRRRLSDAGRAEELAHDVFVAILQNPTRYEARSAFRSYVFGICWNLLMAERRTRRHAVPVEDDLPAPGADPDAALWVRRALATLDEDARDLVMLREYEQLSYQEIADLLRIPLNTVRSRLFRARMELRDALSGRRPGEGQS